MKKMKILVGSILVTAIILSGCASMTRTQKGAAIGTTGGAATGAIIGRAAGNTALGAIIGAAVGGTTGAIIGKQMDKQAAELKNVPNAKVERVEEGIILELNDKVLFDLGKSNLTTNSKRSLDKVVEIFAKYPDTNIEIQGHTDNTGSDEFNQTLSEQRAQSVYNYLTSKNISGSRLRTKGFGENAPKYSNDTETNRSQNRHVEFLIYASEKMKADAKKQAGN